MWALFLAGFSNSAKINIRSEPVNQFMWKFKTKIHVIYYTQCYAHRASLSEPFAYRQCDIKIFWWAQYTIKVQVVNTLNANEQRTRIFSTRLRRAKAAVWWKYVIQQKHLFPNKIYKMAIFSYSFFRSSADFAKNQLNYSNYHNPINGIGI